MTYRTLKETLDDLADQFKLEIKEGF